MIGFNHINNEFKVISLGALIHCGVSEGIQWEGRGGGGEREEKVEEEEEEEYIQDK